MAGRKRRIGDAAAVVVNERGRVRKRPRREGAKRSINLVILDRMAVDLEMLAAARRTSPAEIVMDLLEAECAGMSFRPPGSAAKPAADAAA